MLIKFVILEKLTAYLALLELQSQVFCIIRPCGIRRITYDLMTRLTDVLVTFLIAEIKIPNSHGERRKGFRSSPIVEAAVHLQLAPGRAAWQKALQRRDSAWRAEDSTQQGQARLFLLCLIQAVESAYYPHS